MKIKLLAIIFVMALFAVACSLKAQSAVNPAPKPNCSITAGGDYVAISAAKKATPAKPTGKTFTDSRGVSYPVFEGSKGGRYYVRKSAKGTEYKVYLRTE